MSELKVHLPHLHNDRVTVGIIISSAILARSLFVDKFNGINKTKEPGVEVAFPNCE